MHKQVQTLKYTIYNLRIPEKETDLWPKINTEHKHNTTRWKRELKKVQKKKKASNKERNEAAARVRWISIEE